MARILLFLVLVSSGVTQAQIVNIPDANFKQFLLESAIDSNNDGQIQASEAAAVLELSVYDYDISSLEGIESFINLRKLTITNANANIPSLDVSMIPHLKELFCKAIGLTYLNVSGLTELETLDCSFNHLSSLSVSYLYSLKHLDCSENYSTQSVVSMSSLNLEGATALETLNCEYNVLSVLILPQAPNLKEIICGESNLTSINIAGFSNLERFDSAQSMLGSLDVSGLYSLKYMKISDNAIASPLDFSDSPLLERLWADNNQIPSVILGDKPNLEYLNVRDNQLSEIDISGCPVLENLSCSSNQINYLNLKNGDAALQSFSCNQDSINDIYICVDEGEDDYIQMHLADFGLTAANIQMSTYCSFFPGGDYNVIKGSMIFDNDGDGCDSNDSVINNIKLNVSNGTESHSTISSLGLYNIFTQAGTYTITPDFENDHFTITPPFAEINFTEVDSLVTTQNFCLRPNGNHPDLDIVIVPFGARPGFAADYKIIYRNKGNQTLSGDIVFAYEEDVLDFISANPPQDTSALGTLTWNYIGLAPFEQRQIFVTLNVNGPMETPAVNIDDNLQFTATINPVTGDDTPLDNVFGLKETVIGSFDPNDITCLEGRSVNPDKIGEYLHYNINFENTGTAPATFIVVKDVVDTTQFDMASLQMINASHPVQATVTGNKVELRFDEINLGPQGKGNVVFKVKTLNTLQVNDDVTQQADIFFDYNWPIVTNEATTVFEVLSRGEFEKDNTIKIYPNPSNGLVNITAASEIRSVELYDIQGRLLQAGGNASLDISGRAAGMYFINVLTEAGMKVEKVVKK